MFAGIIAFFVVSTVALAIVGDTTIAAFIGIVAGVAAFLHGVNRAQERY